MEAKHKYRSEIIIVLNSLGAEMPFHDQPT